MTRVAAPSVAVNRSLKADNIEIDGVFGRLRIPQLEAHGTDLSADAIARLLDPKDFEDSAGRLKSANIGSLRIPRLEFDLRTGGGASRLTMTDVTFDGLADGKLARLRASGITHSDGNAANDATAGPLSVEGLDLDLVVRVAREKRDGREANLQPLLDRLSLAHVRLGTANPVTSDEFTIRGLRMRPFTITPQAFAALAAQPKTPTSEQARNLFVLDVANSIAVLAMEVRQLRAFDRPADPPAFELGRLRLSYAAGTFGEITLRGFTAGRDAFRFGKVAALDIDLTRMLRTSADVVTGRSKVENLNWLTIAPSVRQIRIEGVSVGAPPFAHVVDGTLRPLTLGSYRVERADAASGLPEAASLRLEHLAGAFNPKTLRGSDADGHMRELGYVGFDVSSRIELAWDQATERLTVQPAAVDLAGMIKMSVSGLLVDMGTDLYSDSKAVAQSALLKIKFKRVGLRIEDEGLLDREIRLGAGQMGVAVEWFRVALAAVVRGWIETALLREPAATALGDAVAAFIRKPGVLQVEVEADRPLGFTDVPLFQSPAALLRRLKVTAAAHP